METGAYCSVFGCRRSFVHLFPWLFDYCCLMAVPLAFNLAGGENRPFGNRAQQIIRFPPHTGPARPGKNACWATVGSLSLVPAAAVRHHVRSHNREVAIPSWNELAAFVSEPFGQTRSPTKPAMDPLLPRVGVGFAILWPAGGLLPASGWRCGR